MSSNGKAPWGDENHSFSLCFAKFIFKTVKHFLSPKAGNTTSRFLSVMQQVSWLAKPSLGRLVLLWGKNTGGWSKGKALCLELSWAQTSNDRLHARRGSGSRQVCRQRGLSSEQSRHEEPGSCTRCHSCLRSAQKELQAELSPPPPLSVGETKPWPANSTRRINYNLYTSSSSTWQIWSWFFSKLLYVVSFHVYPLLQNQGSSII